MVRWKVGKKKDAGLHLRLPANVSTSAYPCALVMCLIFEDLLHLARFALNFPRHFFPFAATFQVRIVRRYADAFFYSALNFAHFAFGLIKSAIFHTSI